MTSHEFQRQLVRRASSAKIDLPAALGEQLEAYYRLLAHWNASINLTALALDPLTDQAVDRLFIEPLAAARYVLTDSPIWFDVGSGGGSPAIPLKLAKPGARLTMVESKGRKAAFLREAVRELDIANTAVKAERFEEVAADPRLAGTVDLITLRAVRADPALLAAVAALARVSALVLLFGAKRPEVDVLKGFELPQEASNSPPDVRGSALVVLRRVTR